MSGATSTRPHRLPTLIWKVHFGQRHHLLRHHLHLPGQRVVIHLRLHAIRRANELQRRRGRDGETPLLRSQEHVHENSLAGCVLPQFHDLGDRRHTHYERRGHPIAHHRPALACARPVGVGQRVVGGLHSPTRQRDLSRVGCEHRLVATEHD